MIAAFLAFFVASFIAGGLNSVFIKFATQEIPPLTLTAFRFLGATLLLLPFWLKEKHVIPRKDFAKMLLFSANVALFSIGVQYTSVVMSNILYILVPILVAVLGYAFIGEKLSRQHIAGLIVSLTGVSILAKGSILTADLLTFGTLKGNLIIFVAVFSWASWVVAARSLSKRYSSLVILFYCFLLSALLLLLLMPFEWQIRPLTLSAITEKSLLSLAGLIFLSSVISYFLYQYLIEKTTAFVASLIQYGAFVFSIFSGAITFHEHLTIELFLGALLVIAGVFLATTYTQLKKQRI